ncbi:hypothetical protein NPX13_g10239 [Xylaria arbuscula]|uniref:Uncharacterized protein n=1 Tax=Xylaria arbuscula TaxID=114810 RepID=A0A9W8N557_9PEZI|nr:hypothetical protein NPX13_g10239 [Xylaria arbuscula]
MSSSTTSSAREPKWALPQVQVIRYLTARILYKGKVTPREMEWFLSALWPEGLSQGLYQLLDVESPSLINEATSGLAACEADRKAMICNEFAERVQDTRCITPAMLRGLVVALSGSTNASVTQIEEDVTQETMDCFVRYIWPSRSFDSKRAAFALISTPSQPATYDHQFHRPLPIIVKISKYNSHAVCSGRQHLHHVIYLPASRVRASPYSPPRPGLVLQPASATESSCIRVFISPLVPAPTPALILPLGSKTRYDALQGSPGAKMPVGIVLAGATSCEWIRLGVQLPPLPSLRSRISAPCDVLNDYPWDKNIVHREHWVFYSDDEPEIDVEPTWQRFRDTATEKIGRMTPGDQSQLLGELCCALSVQQVAITDAIVEQERIDQEMDGHRGLGHIVQIEDVVAQRRYTTEAGNRDYWWVFRDEGNVCEWEAEVAKATTTTAAPMVMAWKDRSSSREGLCAVCEWAQRRVQRR